MRSSRERVPTSVQPHPQAPSEPSESWGPARAAARRALLALQKPAGRRRKITAGRRALGGSRSAAAVGRGGLGWVGSAPPQSRAPAARGLEARQMPAASCTSHAPSPPLSSAGRSPPSSSTQSRAGERDPPPARPAAVLCGLRPRRAHTLPLGSSLQASMASGPPGAAGGSQAAGGRRCGLGPSLQARGWAASCWGVSGWDAPREERQSAAQRVPAAAPRDPGDLQQCGAAGHRVEPRSLPELFLTPQRQPLLLLPGDVRLRGGVSVNPRLAPPRGRLAARPPVDRARLPASGTGGS